MDYPVKTEGGLKPAMITQVDEKGVPIPGGLSVPCMFNPYEYKISQSNTYKKPPKSDAKTDKKELVEVGSQTLALELFFDTYESGKDVSLITRNLWDLMRPGGGKLLFGLADKPKQPVPYVAFQWGVFRFVSFIKRMDQTFILFDKVGTPLRAKVSVTFEQHQDIDDYLNQPQNPTSGGGPIDRIWTVKAGDRIDNIAAVVYSDATRWRLIADFNHLHNPFDLRAGAQLTIPLEHAVT